MFDESHAMANAAGGKGERGDQAPSQQGRAGLRLQHALPNARVVYVSATGATTVHNLAYAQRLGLWGGEDFPFATRAEFVACDRGWRRRRHGGAGPRSQGARPLCRPLLSYEGVEYELVEHALTPEQIRIYDAYAGALSDHPQQPRRRPAGRQRHRRARHAQRAGQVRQHGRPSNPPSSGSSRT